MLLCFFRCSFIIFFSRSVIAAAAAHMAFIHSLAVESIAKSVFQRESMLIGAEKQCDNNRSEKKLNIMMDTMYCEN